MVQKYTTYDVSELWKNDQMCEVDALMHLLSNHLHGCKEALPFLAYIVLKMHDDFHGIDETTENPREKSFVH